MGCGVMDSGKVWNGGVEGVLEIGCVSGWGVTGQCCLEVGWGGWNVAWSLRLGWVWVTWGKQVGGDDGDMGWVWLDC